MVQSPNHLCVPLLDSPVCPWLCCTGVLRTGHSTPGVASLVVHRSKGSPLWPAGDFLMQPRVPFAFFAARVHCWIVFNLVSTRILRSFSAELFSSWAAPSTHQCKELLLPRYRTLYFPLLNSMIYLSSQFSRLLRFLWSTAWLSGISGTPPAFATSVNLLRIHSTPLSRSLMTMAYRVRHRHAELLVSNQTWCHYHHTLDLVVQPIFHPSQRSVRPYSTSLRGFYETKASLKPRLTISSAFLLSYQSSHFTGRSLWSWSSMTNPWWSHDEYSW